MTMGPVAFDVYGDVVFTSKDLNRRGGEVLNRARSSPVTISRNNELFALLKREQASRLVSAVRRLGDSIALLSQVESCIRGSRPAPRYEWLTAFEKDDLQRLSMEVLDATARASNAEEPDWSEVDNLIHEWKESALAAQSGDLDEALRSAPEERVELPHPDDIGA